MLREEAGAGARTTMGSAVEKMSADEEVEDGEADDDDSVVLFFCDV